MNVKNSLLISGALSLLFISNSLMAGVQVLDFDTFQDGQIIDNEYLADYGVSIDSYNYQQGVQGRQVAFDTLNNNSRDNDLEYYNSQNDYNSSNEYSYTALTMPDYQGNETPGNVLILQENNWGCSDGICNYPDDEGGKAAGYFEFTFSSLVNILNIDFFDVEEQRGVDSNFYSINFFDQYDNEINPNYFVPTMGDGQFVRMAFNDVENVKRLVLNLPGSGAIDNLAFEATEVPAPSVITILSFALVFSFRQKIFPKLTPKN